ncbi:hypothetical protein AB0I28_04945 [Phytomonospora sp. NPDC050363]|uniref:hypothetical protein n=1 Tax=Phytomonospora sp. NPDC050363 TaxID=3155642 RepID=UPI0033C13433
MAIVCRNCGRQNPDDAQFCANNDCGVFLDWDRGDGTPPPVRGGTGIPRPPSEAQQAAAAASLSDSALAVQPGETVATTVTVHNAGSQVEEFVILVIGPAAAWATVEPDRLSIYPGQRAEATVRISPPRRPETSPGNAWFTVRAASTLHRGLTADVQATVEVGEYRELVATLQPQRGSGRGATRHVVDMLNTGNVIEAVRLTGTDPTGQIRFDLPADERAVPPGQQRVMFHVKPPGKLTGRAQNLPFSVIVSPRDPTPAIRLDGDREVVPFIAGWVPKVAAGLAAVAVVASIGLMWIRPQLMGEALPDNSAAPSSGPPAPSAKGSDAASKEPEKTEEPTPTPEPKPEFHPPVLEPEDCIDYDPDGLTVVDLGADGWRLEDNGNLLTLYDNQDDALRGLDLARHHDRFCFIGRGNARPDPQQFIYEYWLGEGTSDSDVNEDTCVTYDSDAVRYEASGDTFSVYAADQPLMLLDNELDAQNAVRLADAYSKMCTIGYWNSRADYYSYLTYFWLP